jgi:hypothetical protein
MSDAFASELGRISKEIGYPTTNHPIGGSFAERIDRYDAEIGKHAVVRAMSIELFLTMAQKYTSELKDVDDRCSVQILEDLQKDTALCIEWIRAIDHDMEHTRMLRNLASVDS